VQNNFCEMKKQYSLPIVMLIVMMIIMIMIIMANSNSLLLLQSLVTLIIKSSASLNFPWILWIKYRLIIFLVFISEIVCTLIFCTLSWLEKTALERVMLTSA